MRQYSVAVASLAIDAPVKWTDNLIAHHSLPDVRSKSRGIARGISWAGLVRIALIRELHRSLGCGVREAVDLADRLLRAPDSAVRLGRWSTIGFERREFEEELQRRLAEALETAPRPRRGRPARRLVRANAQPAGGQNEAGRR